MLVVAVAGLAIAINLSQHGHRITIVGWGSLEGPRAALLKHFMIRY